MPRSAPAEPWLAFLNDFDAQLEEVTELHCIGGFAIVQAYGLERATADIDVLSVAPYHSGSHLIGRKRVGAPPEAPHLSRCRNCGHRPGRLREQVGAALRWGVGQPPIVCP